MSDPYVPFSRWFTNERKRELDETYRLYEWVKWHQDRFSDDPKTIALSLYHELFEDLEGELTQAFAMAAFDLLADEPFAWPPPPPAFDRMNLQEYVEYRNLLLAKQYFFQNKDELLQLYRETVVRELGGIILELPKTEEPSPFTIPLIYALEKPRLMVEKAYGTILNGDFYDRGMFKKLTEQFCHNLIQVNGGEGKPLKPARDSKLPVEEVVDAYLGGTPFQALFKSPVPLKFSHEERFGHMHVVGGTGAGKTTLIKNLVLNDIASEERPSLVVIDPHSDLINELIRSDLGIDDRLIYINPRDTEHPVALNPFAVNRDRLENYDEATREQVTAGVIQTFGYLFNGLTNLGLTGKQEVFFRYVTRLMLMLPIAGVRNREDGHLDYRNATILDVLNLMTDPVPYGDAIAALPEIPRQFFMRDFSSDTYKQTKEQVRYRLQMQIESPTMARLFTAPETKVDFYSALNSGAVILVDTAKDFLKDGSAVFGKLIISLILQAVLERAAIPEHKRRPTFIMVDEAGSFFSSNIDDLLTEARKYKAGLVLAHQYLDQASSGLRASLAANTGIKFASGVSASDARSLSSEFRTTPEFILDQPRLQFAAYIKNVTSQAVSVPIKRPAALPRLSPSAFDALIERNRARVSLPQRASNRSSHFSGFQDRAAQRGSHPSAQDEDLSPDWSGSSPTTER